MPKNQATAPHGLCLSESGLYRLTQTEGTSTVKKRSTFQVQKDTNPWTQEHWNADQQERILRKYPDKARQLAAEAGCDLFGSRLWEPTEGTST